MRKAIVLLSVLTLLILAAGIGFTADTEHGKGVYAEQRCAMCHSIAGKGNPKSPLDGVGSKLKVDEIKKWVKTPKEMKADTKMKAYPTVADKDLEDLAAYLLTLKK